MLGNDERDPDSSPLCLTDIATVPFNQPTTVAYPLLDVYLGLINEAGGAHAYYYSPHSRFRGLHRTS